MAEVHQQSDITNLKALVQANSFSEAWIGPKMGDSLWHWPVGKTIWLLYPSNQMHTLITYAVLQYVRNRGLVFYSTKKDHKRSIEVQIFLL